MVRINSCKYGEMTIDRKTYYSDMVVYWSGEKEFRKKSHIFGVEEAEGMLRKRPYGIVVGTGIEDMALKIPEKTRDLIDQAGVRLFVDKTPNAIEIFNAFIAAKKRIIAVIHTSL